jgi:hypothetical protein
MTRDDAKQEAERRQRNVDDRRIPREFWWAYSPERGDWVVYGADGGDVGHVVAV